VKRENLKAETRSRIHQTKTRLGVVVKWGKGREPNGGNRGGAGNRERSKSPKEIWKKNLAKKRFREERRKKGGEREKRANIRGRIKMETGRGRQGVTSRGKLRPAELEDYRSRLCLVESCFHRRDGDKKGPRRGRRNIKGVKSRGKRRRDLAHWV